MSKNEQYIYHRVAIRKGSLAQKGLEKEVARRVGISHEATLISQFIDELYQKLAGEGQEDIDLLALPTRILQEEYQSPLREKKAVSQLVRQRRVTEEEESLEGIDDNLGEFLQS